MAVEIEQKFRSTPEQQSRILNDCPGQQTSYRMQTTYYDTPTGELAARFYTLRCRKENQLCVCTLKTPAGGFGRNEFEVQRNTIEEALPELCKLSNLQELPGLLKDGVVPICGAEFDRIAILQALPGCTVELALDRGILTGGGKAIPLCEVEVELKSGSRDEAWAYAEQLQADFGLMPEKASKFRRALALAKGE